MELDPIIFDLINSKREGEYWDFKEEPHDNNASLLHDIICLSNSLYNGSKYLIFGVSDPKSGTLITGLHKGQKNRKEQVQIIDFLRTKKFAGDVRPEIELKTQIICGKEIDVLVILNTSQCKPFYLTEDYRDQGKVVKAYHIYGRINDGNVPMDKSADIRIIEALWRQRFGLHLSPLEKMKMLLKFPGQWFKNIGNNDVAYHTLHPEYTIAFSAPESFWEPYTLFYINESAFYGKASFKFHTTTLFELEYMYCDEMRIVLPVPETEYIKFSKTEQWFYYYNLETLSGVFLYFRIKSKSWGIICLCIDFLQSE